MGEGSRPPPPPPRSPSPQPKLPSTPVQRRFTHTGWAERRMREPVALGRADRPYAREFSNLLETPFKCTSSGTPRAPPHKRPKSPPGEARRGRGAAQERPKSRRAGRDNKLTKGLPEPLSPEPLGPYPTYFSCISCTGPLKYIYIYDPRL